MAERRRVAAVIERDGHVLMVRERVQSAPGRHDGPEYWTLPSSHGGSPVPLLIYCW
jgi:8-oxo-dGTP diphosphatase